MSDAGAGDPVSWLLIRRGWRRIAFWLDRTFRRS